MDGDMRNLHLVYVRRKKLDWLLRRACTPGPPALDLHFRPRRRKGSVHAFRIARG